MIPEHYKLNGPSTICFSGGRTSGKMLYDYLDAHNGVLPPDTKVCFENTGKEREETLRFVRNVEQRWNVPIVWLEYCDQFSVADYIKPDGSLATKRRRWTTEDLSNPAKRGFRIVDFATASRKGEPFDAMLLYYATFRRVVKAERPVLPTVPARMCTTHLKIKTNTRFMMSQGYEYFDAAQGIRYDEPRRWAKMQASNDRSSERFHNVMPLYDGKITKLDVMAFWKQQPFDLELDAESFAGNCDFCFLKNDDKLVNLFRARIAENGGLVSPDIQWWLDKEREAEMSFRKDRTYTSLIQIALSGASLPASTQPTIDCVCGAADD